MGEGTDKGGNMGEGRDKGRNMGEGRDKGGMFGVCQRRNLSLEAVGDGRGEYTGGFCFSIQQG